MKVVSPNVDFGMDGIRSNGAPMNPGSTRMVLAKLMAVALSAFVLAGCATSNSGAPHPQATRGPVPDNVGYAGPAKDKLLWEYRKGLAALRAGDNARARELFDDAIISLGGLVGKDKSARQARSVFHSEAKKNFVGEPYERVMAYYYRGILYWMDGEPDNARACFRSAQIMDSDAANKTYAADYTLLDYLDGFASKKLGGDGADALERATKLSRHPLQQYNPNANVLVFLEFGQGPTKYAAGEYHQHLLFSEHQSLARGAVVKCEDKSVSAYAYDDLYFQATTRGGRVMDQILANKAGVKTATDAAGNVGIISGAILATHQGHHSSADEVGVGLLAAGVLSKIFSAATQPAADIRCWDNLPQYLSFAALQLPPGQHTLTIEFMNAGGYTLPSLTKTVTVNVPNDSRDVVVFVSDQSPTRKTT